MTEIIEIERRSVRAVPPVEAALIEGWHVPFGRGQVRRMNAVTTFGIVPEELFETVEVVERRYATRHRPTWFRMTDLDTELDDLLFARGYERSAGTLVMRGTVVGQPDPWVSMLDAVTPGWLDTLAELGGYSELRVAEIGEGLAALDLDHGVFRLDDRGVGLAVVDAGWVGLFDVAVAPGHRRQGLGTRITRSMLGWASAQGATHAYLQVMADNLAAVELYHRMGFQSSYEYWYRTKD